MKKKSVKTASDGKKPDRFKATRKANGTFGIGNPGPLPGQGMSITRAIKLKLEEVPEGHRKTYLQLLIDRIMKKAIEDGDNVTIKEIWNYIDGMPRTSIQISAGDESIADNPEIMELTRKINDLYKKSNITGNGGGGDGKSADTLDIEASDKK